MRSTYVISDSSFKGMAPDYPNCSTRCISPPMSSSSFKTLIAQITQESLHNQYLPGKVISRVTTDDATADGVDDEVADVQLTDAPFYVVITFTFTMPQVKGKALQPALPAVGAQDR